MKSRSNPFLGLTSTKQFDKLMPTYWNGEFWGCKTGWIAIKQCTPNHLALLFTI